MAKASLFLEAITFHETIFALPFAYTGMVLAAQGLPTWHQFSWVTVAMIAARTLGMAANRIVDRQIDARNPRSASRALPSGKLKPAEMGVLAIAALGVFVFAASRLNMLALALSPVAGFYLMAYPYAKRFTWGASLLLGWALAIAPSAAWIAVKGGLSWQPLLLSLFVAFWAASFDVVYHVQDHDFHVSEGIHSIARRFGPSAAFWWARILDLIALVCLVALGTFMGLEWQFYVGCAVVGGLLIYKYRLVTPCDLSGLRVVFSRINPMVSISIFVASVVAVTI